MDCICLLNAFSLQMVDVPSVVTLEEVDALPDGLTSAVGHQDTANVLGVPMNRINVHLPKGSVAYVAQLQVAVSLKVLLLYLMDLNSSSLR